MRRQKKYNLILFLIILVAGIGLGYAALSANLEIDGTTNLTKTTWDIHFDHIQETSGSVTPNSTTSINAAGDTVTFNVTLSTPGDFYEFTVDAVNAGTVDGMIESFSSTLNGGSISNLPDCLEYSVTYEDDTAIANNHLLEAGHTETYKIRVEFKTNIDGDDLPDSNQTLSFAFSVNHVQKTSSAISVPHPFTGTKYTTIDAGRITIGEAIPGDIVQYSTTEDARNAFSAIFEHDIFFFLKHAIVSGIVTDVDVVFLVTPEMVNDHPGMTAGTYILDDDCDDDSICYENNKSIMLSAFGSSNCSDYMDRYRCRIPLHLFDSEWIYYYEVFASPDGNISADFYDTCGCAKASDPPYYYYGWHE